MLEQRKEEKAEKETTPMMIKQDESKEAINRLAKDAELALIELRPLSRDHQKERVQIFYKKNNRFVSPPLTS